MFGLANLRSNIVIGDFGGLNRAFVSKTTGLDYQTVAIKKLDAEEQLVFGEVYAPGFPDSQGDFMSRESVKKACYEFMRKSAMGNIDTQHDQNPNGSYVVENFIARPDDNIYIPYAWVMGVKVANDVWPLVKSGELNGFSLDGMATRSPCVLDIEVPEILKGETLPTQNHTHQFFVKYDQVGNFLGGHTSAARDGHSHLIKAGTCTEMAMGHNHRFSFVEGLRNVKLAA